MSPFSTFLQRLFGSRSPLTGTWRVIDISVPHRFARYVMELRDDGSLEWAATVPTTDAGDLELAGNGTWRTHRDVLHYTSGEARGSVRYSLEDGNLVLDGLPATKVGPGVRCVLEPGRPLSD